MDGSTIPAALRKLIRWLLYKPNKAPHYADGGARSGKLDSPADVARLVDFKAALVALHYRDGYAGVGFALGEGIGGIDLDDCIDAKGKLAPWARSIVDALDSYTEVSPSGRGLHILVKCDAGLRALGANDSGVEFYPAKRYFTMTGKVTRKQRIRALTPEGYALLAKRHEPKRDNVVQLPPRSGALRVPSAWQYQRFEAVEMLAFIEPDIGRAEWLAIGMALHHASGGSEDAYDLWHEWSAKGAKYNERDWPGQWNSFKGGGEHPVTFASLVKQAQDAGWRKQVERETTPDSTDDDGIEIRIATGKEHRARAFEPAEVLLDGELRLTPGAWILAGKPKQGKTWFAMNLMCAAIGDEPYVGTRRLKPMQALYVSLDDTSEARFQRRMQEMDPSGRLTDYVLITKLRGREHSTLDLLKGVLKQYSEIRFVVIDTLAAFRSAQRSDSPYQQEHDELSAINAWATEQKLVVLVVHHLRKGQVDVNDPYESISGTLGLQGGVDSMIVLHRKDLESDYDEALNEQRAAIWVKGRDMEREHAFGAKLANGRWVPIGSVADVLNAVTNREVMRVLESDKARVWTAKEMHAAGDFGGIRADSVKRAASRMARAGLIIGLKGVGFKWKG